MTRTYSGSCHCGAVRFSCEIDLSSGTSRCNCTICTKARFWKAVIPAGSFRLEAGEEALADYQFGGKNIHHRFCRTCGVKPFGQVYLDASMVGEAMAGPYVAVNVACLDGVSDDELASAPVKFEDGRHGAWDRAPAETRHL